MKRAMKSLSAFDGFGASMYWLRYEKIVHAKRRRDRRITIM